MEPYPMEKLVPKRQVNDSDESGDREVLNATVPEADALRWVSARDVVGLWRDGVLYDGLLEQINMTHDWTDYMWYITT